MLTYYPSIKPYAEHHIKVDELHEIYVEECGNPKGIPILIVHGGPGTGCSEDSRRYCDPDKYRIILFDQRGCGRSKPHAELQDNTTQALVEDMEIIRKSLNVSQWLLLGGSWGSTLSLVYAQTYPQHVTGLILRGIFLGRHEDLQWLCGGHGAKDIFPDYWEDFISIIPENHRHRIIDFYYDLLTSSDEVARLNAAKTWSMWEGRCATLEPREDFLKYMTNAHTALSFARIESYYFLNNCFLEPDQILRNMNSIAQIPGIIIHGRYDIICALSSAWDLHKAWPASQLNIIRNAGHSGSEPGILDGIIHATQEFARRLRK